MGRSSSRTSGLLAAAVLLALLPGCNKSEQGAEQKAAASAAAPSGEAAGPPVWVTISVDWEGAYLDPEALDALRRFRADNPGVPLTHLLNAAYFTKPGADTTHALREMKGALLEGDEAGLHVHLWKSLVEAAGVTPRLERSFLRSDGLIQFDDDIGFDADPAPYQVDELRAIIRRSRELLEQNGFTLAPVFRMAGWLGTPEVLAAARAEGITVDSSSIDPSWLVGEETEVLRARVTEVWPKVDRTTQPFLIDTPAGQLLEMPDTGGMADYATASQMEEHVAWGASSAAASPARPVFVHLGFHAETAAEYAPVLSAALTALRQRGTPMRFATLSAAAEAARAALGPGQAGE